MLNNQQQENVLDTDNSFTQNKKDASASKGERDTASKLDTSQLS